MMGHGHGGLYKDTRQEESERLRRERDQIKFIDFRFEMRQVVGFRKGKRR